MAPPFIHVSDIHGMARLLIIVMGSNGEGKRKNSQVKEVTREENKYIKVGC